MKLLEAIKRRRKGVIGKWEHFFPIYDSYFEKIQKKPLNLLEIGVGDGGSLFTWKKYFPNATITGIDINPDCKKFEEDNIRVFIGDQADTNFLKKINNQRGPFDIIIDDGGHMMNQQIASFKTLFPLLRDGGFYVIEDWHTSYWPSYFDNGEKTIDFLKGLIDGLNFWAMEKIEIIENGKIKTIIAERKRSNFAEIISSIHFYNAIVFIQKGKNQEGTVNNKSVYPKKMKNLMIYISPEKRFLNEKEDLVKKQIDNSLKLGWKKEDIILITNFPYKYQGVKATVLDDSILQDINEKAYKSNAIFQLLTQDIVKEAELWWYHDLDVLELRKVKISEVDLEDTFAGFTADGTKKLDTSSFFFRKYSDKIFEWMRNRTCRLNADEATAFASLAETNYRNINSMYKKLPKKLAKIFSKR